MRLNEYLRTKWQEDAARVDIKPEGKDPEPGSEMKMKVVITITGVKNAPVIGEAPFTFLNTVKGDADKIVCKVTDATAQALEDIAMKALPASAFGTTTKKEKSIAGALNKGMVGTKVTISRSKPELELTYNPQEGIKTKWVFGSAASVD